MGSPTGRGRAAVASLAVAVVAILGLEAGVARSNATFEVNSATDALDAFANDGACATVTGACTLRAAIQEANRHPGADVIEVPAGTYQLAIPPLNQNDITTGDLDITDSVTIIGAGASVTTVDGGVPLPGAPPDVHGLDRLFEVAGGAAVDFSGLTLSDGYAAEYGGAIANNSTATITVTASVLTRNVAEKAGGAIDNHLGGEVHVRDSTVMHNFAYENASALNNNRDGVLTVTDSSVSSNSAADVGLDETLVGAGAISNNAELDTMGTITVRRTTMSDNRAAGGRAGGAIANDGAGTVIVESARFSKNVTTGDGGAISNKSGHVTVTGSTFAENGAHDGGAIHNDGANDGRVTISDSDFSLNSASARGGAIEGGGTGLVTVIDSEFSKNSADDLGGAVSSSDKAATTISETVFTENSGLNGGGFANEGAGPVHVENTAFTGNSAVAGIALASGEGGGMHSNSGGEVVISGGAFTGNKALSGGGLSNEGGGTLTVTGTLFSANSADEQGGGILIESGAVRMVDVDVVGNLAGSPVEAGGGISYAGDKLVGIGESAAIEGSRIQDNVAAGPGGGIDSRGDGPLDVTTTSITGNTAPIGGGIHHVGDATLAVTRSALSGNSAQDGGGLFTDGDGEATIEDSTVSGNRAGGFGGGLLVSSRLVLRGSTVASNTAASGGGINNGGGDLIGDGSVLLANAIVANNLTGGNCAGTITSLGGNVESGDSCRLRELSDQPGADPRLGPLAANGGPTRTHALLAGSPAQDKAVCTAVVACPPVDQRNVARPLFAGFDAGAYESETPPGGGGDQPCAGLTQRPIRADFDSWITQSSPASNFGGDATLKVESKQGANDRALIHFALPPSPPGCELVEAKLRLHSSSATDAHTLQAFRVQSAWSEGGVTWSNQPATAGAPATTQSGLGIREWDVLAQVSDMYTHGAHGFLIRDADEGGSGEQSFHSREKGDDQPPELVLVFADPDAPPQPGDCPTNPQSISADQDSWVSESSPSNNFGNDSTLKVKSQVGSNSRALVRFALPPLPGGCTGIASASLQIEAASAKLERTLEVRQIAGPWTESGVTWSNKPPATGPAVTAPSADGPLEWSVTAEVRAMYGTANHGFLIRDRDEDGVGDEQTLNSRDKLNDGPPRLVLVFDDSAPDTTIHGGPSGFTGDSTPTFDFSSVAGSSFECRVDGGAFSACGSPHTTATLSDGTHTFEVRAVDAAGNSDPTPAGRTFTVDTTPPQTTIDTGPSGLTGDSTPTFGFSSEPGASFECRVGSGAFSACGSPHTTATLSDDTHTFEVRATDAAGNSDPTPAGRTISVDTTAPHAVITAGPDGPTADSTPTFAFSSEAGASFQCRVGSGAFSACASPHTTPAVTDGTHTFEVRAIDAAGNSDPSPAGRTFTVDTTAPQTTITDAPSATTNDTSARFAFTGGQGATFECSLDGVAFAGCASPREYTELADGAHRFSVRAKDGVGNLDPTPAEYSWTIDTAAPPARIDSGADGLTGDATPTFTFSSEPGAGFVCRVDNVPFAACTSPHTTATLPDGAHTFEVRASDQAGNSGLVASRTFTVDTTAPGTTIDTGPTGLTDDATPTFTFSSEPGAGFVCRVGTVPFAACTSPHTTATLADGAHTFEVRATDQAGNTGTVTSRTITVDTTAPETSIDGGPSGLTNDATPTFTFSSEPSASFQCRVGTGAFSACISPYTIGPLADGTHTLEVRAVDAAGNPDTSPASRTITVDTTAPKTTIDSGLAPDTPGGGGGPAPPPPGGVTEQRPPVASGPIPVDVELAYTATVRRRATRFRSLALTGVPAGAVVRVTCEGRSCPRKSLRIASAAGGVVKLRPFLDERLRPGTTLTIRVAKAGMTDAVLILKVRAGKRPRVS